MSALISHDVQHSCTKLLVQYPEYPLWQWILEMKFAKKTVHLDFNNILLQLIAISNSDVKKVKIWLQMQLR